MLVFPRIIAIHSIPLTAKRARFQKLLHIRVAAYDPFSALTRQQSWYFEVFSQLHVTIVISDHAGTAKVNSEIKAGLFEHAGGRLAATTAVWCVRAIIISIQFDTTFQKQLFHTGMHRNQIIFGEVSPGNAGLIADHNQQKTRFPQKMQPLDNLGGNCYILWIL